jgi:ribosome-binding protein aMBF1 (putative translation factor)
MLYRHVKPAEPCELCGQLAVEWEVKTLEGNVLRRCSQCFVKLQKMLANVEWRFEEEGEDFVGE